jgi:hypothetical protein
MIEYTIPERPKSRLQRYRLTAVGRKWAKGHLNQACKVIEETGNEGPDTIG